MKKNILLPIALFAILLTSCAVEDSNKESQRTAQGLMAYNNVNIVLSDYIYVLDVVTMVDYYAQASDDGREVIKRFYFSNYNITSTPTTWILKNETTTWILTHNEKSINEVGAEWSVFVSKVIKSINTTLLFKNNFVLTSNGDKDWTLTIKGMQAGVKNYIFFNNYFNNILSEPIYSGTLNVKGLLLEENTQSLYSYSVDSGSGNTSTDLKLDYKIEEALKYIPSEGRNITRIDDGKLSIVVNNSDGSKDNVEAKIYKDEGDYYCERSLQITFNGEMKVYSY